MDASRATSSSASFCARATLGSAAVPLQNAPSPFKSGQKALLYSPVMA